MIRPWHIWSLFGLCLGVVLAAVVWLTLTAVRLDRAGVEARRQAAVEESVRLALWRMDSDLAALLARESGRPYFAYAPFYPAERAYTRMFSEIRYGEVLVPSPLLTTGSPYILLHFQIGPAGEFTSPQVPTGSLRELAESLYTDAQNIHAAATRLVELKNRVDRSAFANLPLEQPEPPRLAFAPQPAPSSQPDLQPVQEQRLTQGGQQVQRSFVERQARDRAVQQMANPAANTWNERDGSGQVSAGALRPMWLDSRLLLARRVLVGGREYIQGCWLNWPEIDRSHRATIADLFPDARLSAAPVLLATQSADALSASPRDLASLPIRLIPGRPAETLVEGPSPLRISLGVAWVCVLLAGGAVVLLLLGTIALSERRAAFVSAVTHELRTPLTTFRLYTEILTEGLVVEETKRRSYLETLQAEAIRLGHLVENVLAYARLERGHAAARAAPVLLSDLLQGAQPRLAERARQVGLRFELDLGDPALAARQVRAHVPAIEQILFNLVDNACKYARDSQPNVVRLSLASQDRFAVLRVRDFGPGIASAEARRLFRPFRKSARDAANSAPGVGLGLALSRRLARAMHGDLRLAPPDGPGACFELCLPLS